MIAKSGVDWDYFFRIAQRHAVLPLVYRQLRQKAADLVPVGVLTKLKSHYQQNAARNALLTAELCRLIKLLRESGIEAVPFKGPSLALFAYHDITLRRFVDLDILVKKNDLFFASEILTKDGYRIA